MRCAPRRSGAAPASVLAAALAAQIVVWDLDLARLAARRAAVPAVSAGRAPGGGSPPPISRRRPAERAAAIQGLLTGIIRRCNSAVKFLLKILLAIIGLVVVLAVGLAIAVVMLFDPKDYQPLLGKIGGRVDRPQADARRRPRPASFSPAAASRLAAASLGNPPGFPEGEFASVEGAALSIRVWPLLTTRASRDRHGAA